MRDEEKALGELAAVIEAIRDEDGAVPEVMVAVQQRKEDAAGVATLQQELLEDADEMRGGAVGANAVWIFQEAAKRFISQTMYSRYGAPYDFFSIGVAGEPVLVSSMDEAKAAFSDASIQMERSTVALDSYAAQYGASRSSPDIQLIRVGIAEPLPQPVQGLSVTLDEMVGDDAVKVQRVGKRLVIVMDVPEDASVEVVVTGAPIVERAQMGRVKYHIKGGELSRVCAVPSGWATQTWAITRAEDGALAEWVPPIFADYARFDEALAVEGPCRPRLVTMVRRGRRTRRYRNESFDDG